MSASAPPRRTHVPKFGNWDANDHMPYTAVFDHARQGRGKPINPNDPSENPSMYAAGKGGGGGAPGVPRRHFNPNDPEDSPDGTDHQPQPERPQERQPERPLVQQASGSSREGSGSGGGSVRAGGQPQQQPQQQQPHQVAAGAERRRGSSGHANVPSRGPSAEINRRTSRDNGLDRNNVESPSTSFSADQSPSHPSGARFEGSHGARAATRLGGNSPAWDPTRRKSTGEDGQMFAPATPNRSRLGNGKTNREDVSAKGTSAALPKFGAWDAQDPGSGDGFTVIFNNARNEKKTGGPVNIVRTPDKDNTDLYGTPDNTYAKGNSGKSSWWCCWTPAVNA